MNQSLDHDPLNWEESARTDSRNWVLLLFGAIFLCAAGMIEPSTRCKESGECLLPLAIPTIIGLGAIAIALANLRSNPRRGFKVDPVTGELVWWKNRNRTCAGDGARIAPAEIARIKVVSTTESDELHVYDRSGERLPYLDSAVIRDAPIIWARKLVARWPHIMLEER